MSDDRQGITKFLEEHLEGYALPQRLYIDPDLFALEEENILDACGCMPGTSVRSRPRVIFLL